MKRLAIVLLFALLLGGCFLWQSFPDNDPLTAGLGKLYEGFRITSAEKDEAHGVVVIKWAIVDTDVPDGSEPPAIAWGVVYLPYVTFVAQKYQETVEAAFREAVFCINRPEEEKPCKTQ